MKTIKTLGKIIGILALVWVTTGLSSQIFAPADLWAAVSGAKFRIFGGGVSPNGSSSMSYCDEDAMGSNSAECLITQQSYLAHQATGTDTLENKTLVSPVITGTATNTGATIAGGTYTPGSGTVTRDWTVTADASGGDAGARSEIQGRLKFYVQALGDGTNGSTETVALMDDSPANEWIALETGAGDVTVSDDSTVYRAGSNSLKVVFGSTVGVADGVTNNAADDDWSGNESLGAWMRADTALSAGDLIISCNATIDHSFNIPAITQADVWQWVEVDISGGATTCSDMTTLRILAGNTSARVLGLTWYIDGFYKWDADDEESLGKNIIQDGVYSVTGTLIGATATGTTANEVEYTDWFTHYQTSTDAIVWITDQSGSSHQAFVGYQ